jgi:hypothetical protein
MNEIRTRVLVGPDHRISGTAPEEVPPGEHEVVITVVRRPDPKRFRLADMPVHDTPWDGSISLRREDMYGEDIDRAIETIKALGKRTGKISVAELLSARHAGHKR